VNRVARRTVHASLLATIIAAAACGGSDSGPSEPSLGNSTVQLSRDSATLNTGDTLRHTATVRDAEGQPVANATLEWSSSVPTVATVDDGLITVLAQGATEISATAGGTPAKARINAYAGSGTRQPGMDSYDRIIPSLMAKWEIPGGAVAVVKDGKLLFARGYGYADLETHQPVAADALFRIASVSKPITSATILKLVDEGELSLDDHPFAILSDLTAPSGATEDPRLADITIRHLLEHAGGWDRDASGDPMFMSSSIAAALGTEAPASTDDVIRYMRGQPLDFDPGSRYVYSNFGYAVLGRVIEKITGEQYEDYVKSTVLEPMGISRMAIGATLLSGRLDGEVKYYEKAGNATSVFPGGGSVPWPYGGFYLEAMYSNGAWVSSSIDLLRFLVHIDPRTAPTPFLSTASTDAMLARPPAPLWQGSAYWYGMGWLVRPSGDDANWWHDGSLPGTTTLLVRAYNGLDWVALFNARSSSSSSSFAAELDGALWDAAGDVTQWPTKDLFEEYP
jgi:N-acyl-D-amino-acid deacylase